MTQYVGTFPWRSDSVCPSAGELFLEMKALEKHIECFKVAARQAIAYVKYPDAPSLDWKPLRAYIHRWAVYVGYNDGLFYGCRPNTPQAWKEAADSVLSRLEAELLSVKELWHIEVKREKQGPWYCKEGGCDLCQP